jgi:hypothetical protein
MFLFDSPSLVFLLMFAASFLALELGYQVARRTRVNDDAGHHEQITGLRDSLLVLLSLLIGFTYSMAVSRFDHRRQLLVEEANAIGTAILRAQTLPEPQQSAMTRSLREYVEARIEFSNQTLGSQGFQDARARSKRLQDDLWAQTVSLSGQDRGPVFTAFMQSLNETIDLDGKRLAALENRIPALIWILVTVIAILASFTTGYSLRRRFWFPAVIMPLMFAVSIALISDLDTSVTGFIRTSQQSLLRLHDPGR